MSREVNYQRLSKADRQRLGCRGCRDLELERVAPLPPHVKRERYYCAATPRPLADPGTGRCEDSP